MSGGDAGVQEDLKKIIVRSLAQDYISRSPIDGIPTGNHYQTISLDGEQSRGFRTDRSEILDHIRFRGQRVLDLGSNLGEVSRAARARGATLVDGFEYDPFFLKLSQVISAHEGTTRVSFYRRDI